MEIASWLGMGACVPFSFKFQVAIWCRPVLAPCIQSQSLGFLCALALLCLEGLVSLLSSIPSGLTLFTLPLPHGSMSQEERYLMETSCSGLRLQGLSISAYHLAAVPSVGSHLWQKKLLWWVSKALICEKSTMRLVVIPLLPSFSRTVVLGPTLGHTQK